MRKKIFGVVVMAAIAAAASWNFSNKQTDVAFSDLTLENIDALAYPEIPGFNNYKVYKTWNYNYTPPRIQTSCHEGGSSVCA